jgi:hypothetical protein
MMSCPLKTTVLVTTRSPAPTPSSELYMQQLNMNREAGHALANTGDYLSGRTGSDPARRVYPGSWPGLANNVANNPRIHKLPGSR